MTAIDGPNHCDSHQSVKLKCDAVERLVLIAKVSKTPSVDC